MICAHCGTENPNSNWYCDSCGRNLREQALASDTRLKAESTESRKPPKARRGKSAPDKGELFAGRYSGLHKIGEGAMSTVYRARDQVLDQVVALKILKPSLAGDQEYIGRFKREIALARTITHPNVYRIFDIGSTEDTHFISMEYVEGLELKSLIGKGKVDLKRGLDIACQTARALEQAHAKGIIHRDLKPQNIIVEQGGRCVVMDFGIATGKSCSALTQTGTFLGTPEYISPEQAQGLALDHRTDLYSLGVIMYEMFTGSLPFGPGEPVAVALSHVKETPVRPRKLAPGIPENLEAVILKAMAKDPEQRFPDSSALIAALEALDKTRAAKGRSSRRKDEVEEAQLQLSVQNPYLDRKMIRDLRYFYGRRKEISTIYSRLGASRPQSVSVVGERRIGKSSLLSYIYHDENRRARLKNTDSYVFLFLDFQEKRGVSLKEFFGSLFEGLKSAAKDRIGSFPRPGYHGLKTVCEELDSKDMKLILLLDEFEAITKNKNFDPEFFSFLRSLANNYNVAYVTSSIKNLQELCYNREISDSPFFNIFSNINLSVFTPEEARRFVCEPSRQYGNPLEEHFDTVVELAGLFPFYMAIACSVLFDFDFEKADPKKTVFENVEERFLEEAGMHFQFILNHLTRDERRACWKLLQGQKPTDLESYALKDLQKRGYVIADEASGEMELFSQTFGKLLAEDMVKRGEMKKEAPR